MNRGLILKAIRESWLPTLLFGLGLFGFELLLASVLPLYWESTAGQIFRMPFVRNLVSALVGGDLGEDVGLVSLGSIAWVHPVVLTLLWSHEIVHSTRFPTAEIDRGTVDVLLGLPVSRWQAFLSESFVWLVSGLFLVICALAGNVLGSMDIAAADRPTPTALILVVTNLLLVYLAVGGLGYFVAACSDRRGRAISCVFTGVGAAFALDFVSRLWEPAERLAFLGLLNYYQPLEIIRHGILPWDHVVVLGGVGVTLWTAAGVVLSRRSICTV